MLTLTSAVAASGTKMAIGDAAVTALLGYAVVFFGLVLLMIVIVIMGKLMTKSKKTDASAAPTPAVPVQVTPVAAPAPAAPVVTYGNEKAPGSAGEIFLCCVPEREAAIIMAIVADKMGKPLNELRFKSIKEVKK